MLKNDWSEEIPSKNVKLKKGREEIKIQIQINFKGMSVHPE